MTTGGSEDPRSQDHLESLGHAECIRRLEAAGVGRIGVQSGGKVLIFPVNYALDGDSIVVRTRRGGGLDEATSNAFVAFEIDHADARYHEGWSVLVQGRCAHVTDAEELESLSHLPILPWGGSERDLYLRVSMDSVTGRSIHHRAF